MIDQMSSEKNKERFESFLISKKSSCTLGYRACARYNRGEECNLGKWHLTHKPDGLWTSNGARRRHEQDQPGPEPPSKRNELRLHICTLCLEALGSAVGHSVLNCPWIKKENWKE